MGADQSSILLNGHQKMSMLNKQEWETCNPYDLRGTNVAAYQDRDGHKINVFKNSR